MWQYSRFKLETVISFKFLIMEIWTYYCQGSRSRSRNYNYELCYDVICDLRYLWCHISSTPPPPPCHKLSHFYKPPPPPKKCTYFMNGPKGQVSSQVTTSQVTEDKSQIKWQVTYSKSQVKSQRARHVTSHKGQVSSQVTSQFFQRRDKT